MRRSKLIGITILLIFVLVACGSSETEQAQDISPATLPAGDPVYGESLYVGTCIACHGPNGEGIDNLGKPFTTSSFIRDVTDQELLEFINEGRPADDPENTTGIAMLPKGGNPTLSDNDILDIIAYLRTLQK